MDRSSLHHVSAQLYSVPRYMQSNRTSQRHAHSSLTSNTVLSDRGIGCHTRAMGHAAHLGESTQGVRNLVSKPLGVLHKDDAGGLCQASLLQQTEELRVADQQVGGAHTDEVEGAPRKAGRLHGALQERLCLL